MMHFFVPEGPDGEGRIRITGGDVNHIRNVLRLKPEDEVIVSDGSDADRICRIDQIGKDEVILHVVSEKQNAEPEAEIILLQGLPKKDKMELIIQKAVELGAARIVPVAMDRCVVRWNAEKKDSHVRRWQAISESAAKQCGRGAVPEIAPVSTLREAGRYYAGADLLLMPYENEQDIGHTRKILSGLHCGMKAAVLIGPEGGITPEEAEMMMAEGFQPVSLGRRILRTETAGMALLSWMMLQLEMMRDDDGAGGNE